MLNEFLLNRYRASGFALMVLLMEVSLCDGVLPYIASWNVNYDIYVLDDFRNLEVEADLRARRSPPKLGGVVHPCTIFPFCTLRITYLSLQLVHLSVIAMLMIVTYGDVTGVLPVSPGWLLHTGQIHGTVTLLQLHGTHYCTV